MNMAEGEKGMLIPQDIDGASAHEYIKDQVLKDKIVDTLSKVVNLNGRIFELLWRKGEIYVQIQHGPSIYLEQGKDYIGAGGALHFLPQSLQSIRLQVESFNKKAEAINKFRTKIASLSGEIGPEADNNKFA